MKSREKIRGDREGRIKGERPDDSESSQGAFLKVRLQNDSAGTVRTNPVPDNRRIIRTRLTRSMGEASRLSSYDHKQPEGAGQISIPPGNFRRNFPEVCDIFDFLPPVSFSRRAILNMIPGRIVAIRQPIGLAGGLCAT